MHVWDVIEELIDNFAAPRVGNPFAVDFATLDAMPLLDRALAEAATASVLRSIAEARPRARYLAMLSADLRLLLARHATHFLLAGTGAGADEQARPPASTDYPHYS